MSGYRPVRGARDLAVEDRAERLTVVELGERVELGTGSGSRSARARSRAGRASPTIVCSAVDVRVGEPAPGDRVRTAIIDGGAASPSNGRKSPDWIGWLPCGAAASPPNDTWIARAP